MLYIWPDMLARLGDVMHCVDKKVNRMVKSMYWTVSMGGRWYRSQSLRSGLRARVLGPSA